MPKKCVSLLLVCFCWICSLPAMALPQTQPVEGTESDIVELEMAFANILDTHIPFEHRIALSNGLEAQFDSFAQVKICDPESGIIVDRMDKNDYFGLLLTSDRIVSVKVHRVVFDENGYKIIEIVLSESII